ncbi:MAG: type II secretion system F family protein [Methanosphaera stadtmanae]|nr:type II secretion system F family protein [Methanosphaera stadtmanae]
MIRELITKIGSLTIKLYTSPIDRINRNDDEEKYENNKINKETIDKILNTNKKENPKKINNNIIISIISLMIIAVIFKNIILLEILFIIIITIIFYKTYPKIKEENRQKNVISQLPYGLRQISIELKAGIGLFDAIKTIAHGDYGQLSKEFNITLEEIHYGKNYEEAFESLAKRNNKKIMKKTVNQIIRTLNNGGNLAKTLNLLSNEYMHEMKIRYKEYSEKLNAIMLLYMFIAVLIPVILFIMIIAATTVIGPIIQGELLLVLYLIFFPLIVMTMMLFIRRLKPTL